MRTMIVTVLLALAAPQANAGDVKIDLGFGIHAKGLHVDLDLFRSRYHRRLPPRVERRPQSVREWVPGYYETVRRRVWVPGHFEVVRIGDRERRPIQRCGTPAPYRPAVRRVWVPGHHEVVTERVWHPGHWRYVCDTPGHRQNYR